MPILCWRGELGRGREVRQCFVHVEVPISRDILGRVPQNFS